MIKIKVINSLPLLGHSWSKLICAAIAAALLKI